MIEKLIKKYADLWNSNPANLPLWVIAAKPGDQINVPKITFRTAEGVTTGMEMLVQAHIIMLNEDLSPENLLSTFLHEYGHARYRAAHLDQFDEIASETEAIRYSLKALVEEGFPKLAHREALKIQQMAHVEPYKSAVLRLANDPVWSNSLLDYHARPFDIAPHEIS